MLGRLIKIGFVLVGAGLVLRCLAAVEAAPLPLADADILAIHTLSAYPNVAQPGDAFYLAEYQIEYAVLPTETVSQGWLCRLVDADGAGQLASAQPFAGGGIPDLGYSQGACGFYFESAPAPTGTLRFHLQGNPALSPTPTGLYTESITTRAASDLASDLRALAQRLEDIWDVDLIEPGTDGRLRFTAGGESYFESALPNLRRVAPDLFTLQISSPTLPDREFDTTYQDSRDSLFDGTPIATAFTQTAQAFGATETWARLFAALALCGGVAFIAGTRLPPDENRTSLQVLIACAAFFFSGWLGLVSLQVVGVVLVLILLILGISLFLQRVTA